MSLDAEAVLISAFLVVPEIDFLLRDCERLVLREPDADLSDRGAAIDPLEHASISKNSNARINMQEYISLRFQAVNGENDIGIFQELVFHRLPTLLRSVLQLPPTQSLYLFNEHHVFKPSVSNLAFRWHRDADEQLLAIMATTPHASPIHEYYSCWINLDEVNIDNGTIAFLFAAFESGLSLPTARSRENVPPDEEHSGYAVTAAPGSVVIFSSNTWHRSGVNQTDFPRRVYYAQYSLQPITVKEGGQDYVLSFAIPC